MKILVSSSHIIKFSRTISNLKLLLLRKYNTFFTNNQHSTAWLELSIFLDKVYLIICASLLWLKFPGNRPSYFPYKSKLFLVYAGHSVVIEGNFTDILGGKVGEWEVGELIKPEFGDLKRFEIIL